MSTIQQRLSLFKERLLFPNLSKEADGDYPLQDDLYSIDQLSRHGKAIAQQHELDFSPGKDLLLSRLVNNKKILDETYKLIVVEEQNKNRLAPAAVWLLDNYYLIVEQILTVQNDLPKRYSLELPRLRSGPSAGLPRVFDLVRELISHVDGRVDEGNLSSIVSSYQRVHPFKLGELWAIPIMLRLALIENLRRIAAQIATGRKDRNLANYWAERMLKAAGKNPNDMIIEMAEMVKADIPLSSSFTGEFFRNMQGQNPALFLPLNWLERRLSEKGQTIEKQVQLDNHQQAATQISISNSINSLRLITSVNWKNFVENMSCVEDALAKDPAGVYKKMNFATRDRYRHVVEKISRRSRLSELEVALQAIQMASQNEDQGSRKRHVGYYLVDRGLSLLEKNVRMRLSLGERLSRIGKKAPLLIYLGSIILLTTGLTWMAMKFIPIGGYYRDVIAIILLSVGFSHLAVSLVNWFASLLACPALLPRMDFSNEIPQGSATLITVPSMLSGEKHIEALINKIEVTFLANRTDQLYFSLLTDFMDAPEKDMPDDVRFLKLAKDGIVRLNEKYGQSGKAPFFLFHRARVWNPKERTWMGYERKRGKLESLNAALLSGDLSEITVEGDTSLLSSIKYVITLDTDTQLPHDSARQMIETMSHPLNEPVYDPKKKRVTAGYSILQPRVASSLPSSRKFLFSWIFGSETGIDPYTRAVSDVYQDLFREGSFIGKGIYHVEMITRVLAERFPENRILSHDLLEGNYARSGLVSDIILNEEFPRSYNEDMKRRHRWIRGDWQIAAWLGPVVPGFKKRHVRNHLSLLSRWKIFDNLRRSVVPLSFLLIIVSGWLLVPFSWTGTVLVLAILLLPQLLASILHVLRKPKRYPLHLHFTAVAVSLSRHVLQALFSLVVLPYEAFHNLDAILRTIWRMLFSGKKLLEWTTSVEARRNSGKNLLDYFGQMFQAPLFALVMAGTFYYQNTVLSHHVWTLIGLWFLSPVFCWWISKSTLRSSIRKKTSVSESQNEFLRKTTRKTWRFFETFVGQDDNWLPPDNYQEEPKETLTHMTSPTNIGLMLLSNLGAYDLGYLSAGQFIDRTKKSIRTLESMERFRGHFFNWYDTRTLQPMPPRYVSTVDSGNLAGYLYTLQTGLLELKDKKIFSLSFYNGLDDLLGIIEERLLEGSAGGLKIQKIKSGLERKIRMLRNMIGELGKKEAGLGEILLDLSGLVKQCRNIRESAEIFIDADMVWYFQKFEDQCFNQQEDILFLAPWSGMLEEGTGMDPDLKKILDENRQMSKIADGRGSLYSAGDITERINDQTGGFPGEFYDKLERAYRQGVHRAYERSNQVEKMALQCQALAEQDYDFLYDPSRNLLSIGYNVVQHRRDDSFYDLLASEARLGSFIGIARGKIPLEHWFALGRLITIWKGKTILLSWGGSMFEYLMPQLVMPGYDETLIGQSCQAAVDKQISYGREQGVPWGISESAENMTDSGLKYQYRSFGIPELGFKRGLSDDLVIAPYATMLALMVRPDMACENLMKMRARGYEGRYGFYEAVDYTANRLGQGQSEALIRSFMAHHQGMSFVSLVNYFTGDRMVKRFQTNPLFQVAVLLLQERIPQSAPFQMKFLEPARPSRESEGNENFLRVFNSADTPFPEVHLLSNGRYHVMVTNAGGGYSRWGKLSLTRWCEDTTLDNHGSFIYIHDITSESTWSAAHQPTLVEPSDYEVIFSQARAEFKRRDQGLDTYTEIAVSPEDDIEFRRVTVSNFSVRSRVIELTSFAEVSLMEDRTEENHPAFDKLFIQTEIVSRHQAILCSRRPRSKDERTPWMFHLLVHDELELQDVSYETDRLKFIGRGRSSRNARAMEEPGPLSGAAGPVLDPVMSVRCRLKLRSGESRTIGYITGVAATRQEAVSLIEKYKDRRLADRVFDIALIHGRVTLQQINATESDAQLFGRLASSIIYPGMDRRAGADTLIKNNRGQSGMWAYSISGDLPIVLLRISDHNRIDLVAQMIQAHSYWRFKGLSVDLIIWNEDWSGYRQALQDQIMGLISYGAEVSHFDKPGGIFIRYPDQMTEEDRILMLSSARVIMTDVGGSLEEQLRHIVQNEVTGWKTNVPRNELVSTGTENFGQSRLIFHNGWGGFTEDGREYIFQVRNGECPPMPWVNIVANKRIGSVITQSGGTTWTENAHEFRLTPWYNDPVSDTSGEAVFIRDEDSKKFWSLTPLPAPGPDDYLNRQGFGYSVFEYTFTGIKTEMWVYVDKDDPVKFSLIKIRNDSPGFRRLSIASFYELVMGESRAKNQMHVRTELDNQTGALFAVNAYNTDFAGRVAFLEANETRRSVSGDRKEFIGRNGTLADPAAMHHTRLSGRVGAGFDPAASMQVFIELDPGQEKEVVFIFGAGNDIEEARRLVLRHRGTLPAYEARDRIWEYWNHTLGTIHVETPDTALNIMTNGWLLYQTMTSRIFGRSGFYQSGGAFGFRDQLQDMTALLFAEPGLVRDHLLLCATRQFREGDVQHWWHQPAGRGVRTRISDDYLWMPLVTALYVTRTGDTGVLDETVHFLESRALGPGEDSNYDLPVRSEETASLYEHCRRAVERAFNYGRHGLPLMGSGDWNDGMNLVGIGGEGESVWLAFFLITVLESFISLAHLRGDEAFVLRCSEESEKLKLNIEKNGWDGEWYRRGYFDDGSFLGSSQNQECRIDAIAQIWSVLSGAGSDERQKLAMLSLERKLVDYKNNLILLLDPPFDRSDLEPGYIKGYIPGVRENGGQYTHAAVWAVMAFAKMGEKEKVKSLLSMINPIHHGSSREKVNAFMVEPYVMVADIYNTPAHVGRGGWTWYTGSAAWMYRLITEYVLGLDLKVDKLFFNPCLPVEWGQFKIHYRFRETVYHMEIRQIHDEHEICIIADEIDLADDYLPLVDDRREHFVIIKIGK